VEGRAGPREAEPRPGSANLQDSPIGDQFGRTSDGARAAGLGRVKQNRGLARQMEWIRLAIDSGARKMAPGAQVGPLVGPAAA